MTPTVTDYFDAHLLNAPNASRPGLRGGIVYSSSEMTTVPPFLRSAALNAIIGRDDPRFPSSADVLDLQISASDLLKHLKEPAAHWWPLLGRPREDGKPLVIHLSAIEYGSLAKGVSKLARSFPTARFVLDPFVPGKNANWKAGVCLSDEPNIWITTRGLYACDANWERRSDREAFYFVTGEVGAGRLLFASGSTELPIHPNEWLESIPFLDEAQRRLILVENAAEFLRAEA